MDPRPPVALLDAVALLLRPLVHLLIRAGVTCPTLMDIARGVYIDVARDMVAEPKARTDSRISLMTGIHRKELRRHRGEAPVLPPEPVTIGSQVAARWLGQPGWQDPDGAPLTLPRTGPPGTPSFEALVEAVTRDVRPRAVLDDWLDQGLVTADAEGHLVLQARAFLPKPGGAEQAYYFGRNLHDHLAAAAANLAAPAGHPAGFLDRSVHYDNLSPAAAAALAGVARAAAERMLLDVNRAALAIAEADDAKAGTVAAAGQAVARRSRVNLGAYLFDEDGEAKAASRNMPQSASMDRA